MVPGGWFAERDGFLGDSYTEADLMYRRIAQRVHSEGFIVARYDNRGVTGNEFTMGLKKDSSDPEGDTKRYLECCVNSEIRRSVTPETLTSDVATVFHYLKQHPQVDPSNIVLFAHSEGGIHVARLIGCNRIDPKGIVFAGATTGSPRDVTKWQMVDRYVDELLRWDSDGDGRITASDIEESYSTSFVGEVGISQEELLQDGIFWTEKDARNFFAAKYLEQKVAVMKCPDELPFPDCGEGDLSYIVASHRWLKTFFSDRTSMISLLKNYSGQVAYHFGALDRQLPVQREVDNIKSYAASMSCDPKILIHHNHGHAFGFSKAINGPMDLKAEELFVEEIVQMLHE